MDYKELVKKLVESSSEEACVEYKHNNSDNELIGKYISALANSATMAEKEKAYLIYGISDNRDIVGTTFDPSTAKHGNEVFENWLRRGLSEWASFNIEKTVIDGKDIVIFEIMQAISHPIKFKKVAYTRRGSSLKELEDCADEQKKLWIKLNNKNYEKQNCRADLNEQEVIKLIDYPKMFDMLSKDLPANRNEIVLEMKNRNIIKEQCDGLYAITMMGALLFGKKLDDFDSIKRKAIRVIEYEGINKLKTKKEQIGSYGYAVGFEGLVNYILSQVPANEDMSTPIRKNQYDFPELAIRELVANALIHQDLTIAGAGPMVELYEDRLEISNPGLPLVDVNRIINVPPRSRNEDIAAMMRLLGVCEERGSGYDKIINDIEKHRLPPPMFVQDYDNFKIILYKYKPFSELSKSQKRYATYLHACLLYESNQFMTNSSLRERFGLADSSSANISRLIKECVECEMIALVEETSNKYKQYAPYWAL